MQVKWLKNYIDETPMTSQLDKTIDIVYQWSKQVFAYESKNERLREWNPTEEDIYEIVTNILIVALLHPQGMTYQTTIGYISGSIGCCDPLDRAKTAAEVIAIAYQCDLIVITKTSDTTMMITTEYVMYEDIPEFLDHVPEFHKPYPVTKNQILGNRFKRHDSDICNEHINTMNSIALTLEWCVIDNIEEISKSELDTIEKQDQWIDLKRRSRVMYDHIGSKKFYLNHNYDTRGRCYCEGYYVNYQGSSFKKAIVQLAHKEIVQL